MDAKLKMLDDLFDQYAWDPDKMEELEQKLGIPLSYASWAVVPYSQKVKGENKDQEKKK